MYLINKLWEGQLILILPDHFNTYSLLYCYSKYSLTNAVAKNIQIYMLPYTKEGPTKAPYLCICLSVWHNNWVWSSGQTAISHVFTQSICWPVHDNMYVGMLAYVDIFLNICLQNFAPNSIFIPFLQIYYSVWSFNFCC